MVVKALGGRVAAEAVGQAVVGAAIGVQHQDDAPRSVQAHGFADLLEHELAFGFQVGRGQALGASGDLDGVGVRHADAFEELAESELKAIVEAPDHGGIAVIFLARGVEVKDLVHGDRLSPLLSQRRLYLD